jgi:hypothetical protein
MKKIKYFDKHGNAAKTTGPNEKIKAFSDQI